MAERSKLLAEVGEPLGLAMRRLGHGPTACASTLRELDEACHATPKAVAEWRDGERRPQAKNKRALELYFHMAEEASPVGPGGSSSFDQSVRHLTAEPLLGELQSKLVNAVIDSLATSEISEHSVAERRWAAGVLGLPD